MLLSFVSESYYRLLVCNLSVCVQTRLTMRYTANKQTNWNFFQLLAYNSEIGSSTVENCNRKLSYFKIL